MRFIFTDEAGISTHEPFTVVVGILVDVDDELIRVETLVRDVLGAVPPALREGFCFSAKDVWDGRRYKDAWLLSDRLRLLENMMAVPKKIGLPVVLAAVPRTVLSDRYPDVVKRAHVHHAIAFSYAMSRADKHIRDDGRPNEIGTVIAETVDSKMKTAIRTRMERLRDNPIHFNDEHIYKTDAEASLGYITQETETRISRIRKTLHFVEKSEELTIFVADAWAYAIRAVLSDKEHGDRFIRAMGIPFVTKDWQTVGGATCFKPPRK